MAGLSKCTFGEELGCATCDYVVYAECPKFQRRYMTHLLRSILPFKKVMSANFTGKVVYGRNLRNEYSDQFTVEDVVKTACALRAVQLRRKIYRFNVNQMMQFTINDDRVWDFSICFVELHSDRVFFTDPAEQAKAAQNKEIARSIYRDRVWRLFESFCDLCITHGVPVYAVLSGSVLAGLQFSRSDWSEVTIDPKGNPVLTSGRGPEPVVDKPEMRQRGGELTGRRFTVLGGADCLKDEF